MRETSHMHMLTQQKAKKPNQTNKKSQKNMHDKQEQCGGLDSE